MVSILVVKMDGEKEGARTDEDWRDGGRYKIITRVITSRERETGKACM